MWKIAGVYLLLINLAGFLSMGIDKKKAIKGKWRIPERILFLQALLGGSLGSILGMYTFRHKTKHRQFVIGMPLILLLQQLLAGAFIYQNVTREARYTGIGMGTVITVDAYGKDSEQAVTDIAEMVTELDKHTLSWREPDSAVSHLNAGLQTGEQMTLTQNEQEWLERAIMLCEASEGALDITLRPVLNLWGIEGEHPAVPDEAQLKNILATTGYEKIHISEEGILSAEGTGMSLDLGALGKGIACDEIAEYLHDRKISGAVVSVGGSVLTYGRKPDGGDWMIGIQDPRGEQGSAVGYLAVNEEKVVSTSGDYEKYFVTGNNRYHHIIDPETGYPAESGIISVTVVCDSGIDSDGLSTACFILGRERSRALLEAYDAEAIYITEDKRIYLTDGIRTSFQSVNEGYEVVGD